MLASVANRGFSSRLLPDPAGPVVVLSPHLDDAVLSCWSVLAAAEPVQAVNVFAALPRAGFVTRYDRICGARDSAVHIRVRIEEDRDALGALGRSPLNLPFLDRQYRRPWQTPSLKQLDDEIVQVVPRVRAVYAPAALGFAPQPDHALVRALALNMAAKGVAVWLYADVPYATTFGWPHWVSETPENPFLDVDAYWQPLVAAVPAVGSIRAARVVRLQAPEASRKLAAMEAYRTQFPALDGGPIGALRNPLVHGFEVFWRIGAET
jgi:LmbE family N-acetylglucosaminyl deacetylase